MVYVQSYASGRNGRRVSNLLPFRPLATDSMLRVASGLPDRKLKQTAYGMVYVQAYASGRNGRRLSNLLPFRPLVHSGSFAAVASRKPQVVLSIVLISAMDFLREKFNMVRAAPGPTDTFYVDLLEARPDFDKLAEFNDWSTKIRQEMTDVKARKNCPVIWIGIFVDQVGLSFLLQFAHKLQLSDAKKAAIALSRFLCKGMPDVQNALQSNLRPLDELDRKRIDGWCTQVSLRPRGKKRARQQAEENCQSLAKRPKTIAQLLAEDSSDDEESAARDDSADLPVAPSLLSIRNADVSDDVCVLTDPMLNWAHRLKTECTIVVAEVGQRPAQLSWTGCRPEERKLAFLVHTVQESYDRPGLVNVVRVAAAMAKDGSLPDHTGARGRKSEFLKRCAKALDIVNASAEKDVDKLSKEERDTIRLILGNGEPYSGCFNERCLDQKTTWVEKTVGWERCSRCNLPKSFGRSWKTGSDLIRNQIASTRMRAIYGGPVPIVYLDDSDDEEMPAAPLPEP